MATGCPYIENKTNVTCFNSCKAERLDGHWKICVDSRFDPSREIKPNTFEITASGLTDEAGNELFEVYQAGNYVGSCYAESVQQAQAKAHNNQLLDRVG